MRIEWEAVTPALAVSIVVGAKRVKLHPTCDKKVPGSYKLDIPDTPLDGYGMPVAASVDTDQCPIQKALINMWPSERWC